MVANADFTVLLRVKVINSLSLDVKTPKAIHESLLDNDDLTVIEVDHHIPKSILNMYDKRYNLKPNGLFDIS